VLLVHRRHVVEPVEIGQRLQIGFVLDQLFRSAVKQSDMRIDALYDLAVEFNHKPQDTMSRRVLRPEIDGEIAKSSFSHGDLASAMERPVVEGVP